jgi:erythromycin esterase-like protein
MPKSIVDLVSERAEPLVGAPNDFDSLVDLIGDARFVLIGEASHGTHEFYRIRAQISKVLIAQRGFNAVTVEADWPDAYRVNRFVRGASKDSDSVEALSGFQRFPQWMWRNADVLDFVGASTMTSKPSKIGSVDSTVSIFTVCMLRSKRCLLI